MARDLGRMEAGLRRYLDAGDRITGITVLSAGHSNETYLIEGIDRVLRTEPSEDGLLPPYDMARQHAILSAVGAFPGGPPVPRTHELCTDPSVIGHPFFLMERLEGAAFEYAVPDWLAADPVAGADRLCRQWFGALTSLYHLPAASMPAGARSVQEEAQHWYDVARDADSLPALVAVLEDLVRNPPRPSGPLVPIHGDPKHGNCLWRDGRLVALLDWEMSRVSEPMLDLGYILMFHDQGEHGLANAGYELPGWWSAARMIEAWEEGSGRRALDAARYTVLGQAKVAAIISVGDQLFRSGRSGDKRFGFWGALLPGFIDLLCRRAERA